MQATQLLVDLRQLHSQRRDAKDADSNIQPLQVHAQENAISAAPNIRGASMVDHWHAAVHMLQVHSTSTAHCCAPDNSEPACSFVHKL